MQRRALFLKSFDRDETKHKTSNDFRGPYMIINPLLPFIGRTRRWGNDPVDIRLDFKNPGFPGLVEDHDSGSWRCMLFVQPAIRKLRISCIFSYCKRQCIVSNDKGVTVQDVIQEARRHAKEYRCSHYEWYGTGSSLQHLGIFETEEDYFLEVSEQSTAAWALARIENAGD
ncbi:hypothetical protein HII31_10824 [Pseudocercospora fuligena]|uniref:Uncharacterized protein n=1 Tax=Pseudocercospora fuligena TaxID=685502 RepID=A0A8H6RBJ0_9PEZI|nr:hypothetical protein HII31_10824 [Pseudocercospora fuligena]